MKTTMYKGLVITLLSMTTSLMADNDKMPCERQVEAIYVRNFDSEMLNEFMEGKHPYKSIEFKKGDQFHLSLFLKGDFVELIGEKELPLYVKAKRDLYIRPHENFFLFSLNNTDWKPISDLITGTATIGLSADDEKDIELILGAEAYEKK